MAMSRIRANRSGICEAEKYDPYDLDGKRGPLREEEAPARTAGAVRMKVERRMMKLLANKTLRCCAAALLPLLSTLVHAQQPVNVANTPTVTLSDPCQSGTKSYLNISQTSNTKIITGVSGKNTYICSFFIAPLSSATNIALVEGTGSTCGTGTAGVPGTTGGSTAATGANLSANGGFVLGTGVGAVGKNGTTADDICLLQSAANQISGGLSYVQF